MLELMETKICNKRGTAVPPNPLEIEDLIKRLNEKPQTVLDVIAVCSKYHEPAWHYNFDIFEDAKKITLTTVKRKHGVSLGNMKCDFSDFMDEEELGRLEKRLARTKPSEVMY